MTLHHRPDEEADIDPTDDDDVNTYCNLAEHHHCRDLCARCGQGHAVAACPNGVGP